MFIKDLSASDDLDSASMTAVGRRPSGPPAGQAPPNPQDGVPPVGNGSSPIGSPPYHSYPAFKYNPYHSYYQQPLFPTLMP